MNEVGPILSREDTLKELNELIHDYPVWYPSAVRTGLKDARRCMEQEDEDAERVRKCREGRVVKFLGKGVIILNYEWWIRILEKLGEFKPVPDLKDLNLIESDKLYNHMNDLWLTNAPDDRTKPENVEFQKGICEGLSYAMRAILEAEGRNQDGPGNCEGI